MVSDKTGESIEEQIAEGAADSLATASKIAATFAGATTAQAAVAISICDIISPILIRSVDPRAVAIGAAIRTACRFRRAVRRRT